MTTSEKIKTLYNLPDKVNFGFPETEIISLEKRLNIILPAELRSYYLTFGKNETLNYSHNRLLKPDKEVGFSDDRYLIFYEENQAVVFWGIKEKDLILPNPPVWANNGTEENPDWHIEMNTTDNFILLMSVYNGTLGGLKYNANCCEEIDSKTVGFIENNWSVVKEISGNTQKVYTDNFHEVINLSFDKHNNCTGIFTGTSSKERFDKILDRLEIDWSYTSYEDEG